jgi:hypothetical protein
MLSKESNMSKSLSAAVCVAVILVLCLCSSCGDDETPCTLHIGDYYFEYRDANTLRIDFEWAAPLLDGATVFASDSFATSSWGGVILQLGSRRIEGPWIYPEIVGFMRGEALLHGPYEGFCAVETTGVDTVAFRCELVYPHRFGIYTHRADTVTFYDVSFRVCCDPDWKCTDWTAPISFTLIDTLSR